MLRGFRGDRAVWQTATKPVEILTTGNLAGVEALIAKVERLALDGKTLIGFLSYEASPAFDKALQVSTSSGGVPLLWFAAYDALEESEADMADALPAAPAIDWVDDLAGGGYERAYREIRERIAAGDVYQVNLTRRLRASGPIGAHQLFASMLSAQPNSYAALINIGGHTVCSVSPELFLELEDDSVVSMPMKGTAKRGRTTQEDIDRYCELLASEKERSENLMIVDMMRNDLGRIARLGTVNVTDMFKVHRLPTVFQMTSTVRARTDASLLQILRATFPSASITGAPKVKSMQIIEELEASPRGLYTGCIGMIGPGRQATLSVAIRTAVVGPDGTAEFGVGGGITWDSKLENEQEECSTKALVVTKARESFSLLETMRWTPAEGYFLLDEHLSRLADSADYFGFPLDKREIMAALTDAERTFGAAEMRVRLVVDGRGRVILEAEPLKLVSWPLNVCFANAPVDVESPFLFHKTTRREVYERARSDAGNVDDVLLWNRDGQVTEATVANVVVRIGDELFTPPIKCGLLGGIFRDRLVKTGLVKERIVTIGDCEAADELFLVNSVRGWMRTKLVPPLCQQPDSAP